MHIKIACVIVALAGAGLSAAAGASHEAYPPDGRYETARVVSVEPITRVVRVSTPRRECWDEEYYVTDRHRHRSRGSGHGAVAGAIIGGVIGHQFGSGRGNDAATVAGALLGSRIGADHERERDAYHRHGRGDDYLVRTRTRCTVHSDEHDEERVDGYRVTYEHGGERYTTRMSREPGPTLRVWVSVRPVTE